MDLAAMINAPVGCVALSGVTAGQGQGWSELQIAPAATVDHVWNAVFWLVLQVAAVTLVREWW